MNLGTIRTALQARGFNHLTTTEQNEAINWAYQVDVCEAADWPFLEATETSTAPNTISDLRSVEYVIDSTTDTKLRPLDRSFITDGYDTDLTTTGTPIYYYLTSGPIVNVYPANTTDSILTRYYKAPTALSADGDEPLVPTRFQPIIVDGAVRRAYETSDEWDAAAAAQTLFESRLLTMTESLMVQGHDRPSQFVVTTLDE